MTAPPSSSPWRPALLAVGVAVAFGFHLWTRGALDLRDLPGPAGILLVQDLQTGDSARGAAVALARVFQAAGADPILAATLLTHASVLAGILGAALGARALGGLRAGVVAALLAGLWAPTTAMGWRLGPGVPAWGLSWLGVGLAWLGARSERDRYSVAAGAVATLGAACKASALPALLLLPFAMALDPGTWRARLRRVGALAAGGVLAWAILPTAVGADPYFGGAGDLAVGPVLGLECIARLPDLQMPQGRFFLMFFVAGLAALPGRRHPVRAGVLAVTMAGLAWTAGVLGPNLHPRHLVAGSLGLLLLAGAAVGQCHRPGWVRIGALGLGLAFAGFHALDTVGFARAWDAQRAQHLDIRQTNLPPVPALWTERYPTLARTMFMDETEPGALALMDWSAEPGGVITVVLRDRRQAHARVAAAAAGEQAHVLHRGLCCPDHIPLETCATDVATAALASGSRLVLPVRPEGLDPYEQPWVEALMAAAKDQRRADSHQRWWTAWRARSDGPVPCPDPRAGPAR